MNDYSLEDEFQWLPLHLACFQNDADKVENLLRKK